MTDVLTPAQRQINMSRIRGRDTKPEMLIRSGLHRRGLRYRLHDRKLPGRPDLVFPKYHTAAFIHGCFWHAHSCALSKLPATRREFWAKKLKGNVVRDNRAVEALQADGWRVLVIWECSLRGPGRQEVGSVLDCAVSYIRQGGGSSLMEIAGENSSPEGAIFTNPRHKLGMKKDMPNSP